MKRRDVKSHCPINFTLEIFGDPWAFLIIRDMVMFGKKTYGEFLESDERIVPSVLADRLALLEQKGIVVKQPDPRDGRRAIYSLTALGLTVIPMVYELAVWGSHASPHPDAPKSWFKAIKQDREKILALWHKAVKSGSSFCEGPDSVIKALGLSNT